MLLPNVITHIASVDPSGTFARIPAGPQYADGFLDVTKAEFNQAVNYAACLLRTKFGPCDSYETVAYIGPSDLRYSVMAVASMKAGYKVHSSVQLARTRLIVWTGLFAITEE
jgi:hypothetical protein